MSPEIALDILPPLAVFVLGAWVGSLLNGMIHNTNPGSLRRSPESPCPGCRHPNGHPGGLPIISRLFSRSSCTACGTKLSRRYFIVELLTATIFTLIWLLFASSLSIFAITAIWLLSSLMIAASFIDFDQLIIPDKITLRGLFLGLILSAIAPGLHHELVWYNGLFSSLVGVVTGFCVLWSILIIGRLLYGRVTHEFNEPVDFKISQPNGEDSAIVINFGSDHQYQWHDVFYRRRDKVPVDITDLRINGESVAVDNQFNIVSDGFLIDGVKTELQSVREVTGKCIRAIVPREAIGFGNVKFVAMVGAFVGWQAVLVSTAAAFGIVMLARRFFTASKVPFSPFLATGAFIFILVKFL